MWDMLLQDLPTTILVIIAIIICGAELIKAIRVWREESKKKKDVQLAEQKEKENTRNEFEAMHEKLDEILKRLDCTDSKIGGIEQRVQDLTTSDMHDIKAWIVEQYRIYYIEQGWIDAFHAETIDRRYEDYQKEGGNSYVHTLMERIHTLPMDPPAAKKEEEKEEGKKE